MKGMLFILLIAGQVALAQTAVNKTFPVQSGQQVNLHFDHPELIKVSTWDRNEISITGSVMINNGENDDAFSITSSTNGNVVYVRGEMVNMKSLPRRITIHRDGSTLTFKSKEEYNKYAAQHGRDYDWMNNGVDIEIILEVKVPKNTFTNMKAVYGMVEVRNFEGPIDVLSTYGGVDAALNVKTTGELIAETHYGTIYSNLEVKFTDGEEKNFHSWVKANPGTGPKQSFECKYGNVYLRKPVAN